MGGEEIWELEFVDRNGSTSPEGDERQTVGHLGQRGPLA
jgi:hypothetical protein